MRVQSVLFGALLAGLAAGPVWAQTPLFGLVPASVAKVVQGADTLAHPWAGGLNTPQFSAIDLNGDGQLDLYAFERQTSRSYTFLNVAAASGGGRRYLHAPEYEASFPLDLTGWALLRDYDCDGRPDLFTQTSGANIRVLKNNAGPGGRPVFSLANPLVSYSVGNSPISNLNIGGSNLPAIEDFNGDGRLDIISYDFVDATILGLYLNVSTGSCGGLDRWEQVSGFWGQLRACYDCGEYRLQGAAACVPYRIQHSIGHNVLVLDLNGDGKLDILDGRDNCAKLTRLLNSGSSLANAEFTPANVSTSWPSASAPLNLPVFPAAYRLDADFDGVPDLVIAPNMLDNTLDHVSQRNIVRLYHNTAASAGAVPNFTLTNSAFLQEGMLDVSEGAMPAFGDLDGDGLLDMLIANAGDLVNNYYRASLSYYRNVGTAHRPVYRLVTADFLGLAAAAQANSARFEQLRPALVDLNRDGALDLVYSAYDGTDARLYFLLNTAAAGQPASFDASQASYFRIPGTTQATGFPDTPSDTPCFFDVDNDGYVDLLLGTNHNETNTSGPASLRYFRNRGAAAGGSIAAMFVLANDDYGQLRYGLAHPKLLAPSVADYDGDGTPDLLIADASGTIALYANFRTQSGSFIGRTDLFYSSLQGQYTIATLGGGSILHYAPVAADLNQDGRPELYIGTESGGIVSYLPRSAAALATHPAAAATLAFSVYPNPATESATTETAQPTRLRLLDLTGRQVLADATLARTHRLDLHGLAGGVYIAQAPAADGATTTLKLIVE